MFFKHVVWLKDVAALSISHEFPLVQLHGFVARLVVESHLQIAISLFFSFKLPYHMTSCTPHWVWVVVGRRKSGSVRVYSRQLANIELEQALIDELLQFVLNEGTHFVKRTVVAMRWIEWNSLTVDNEVGQLGSNSLLLFFSSQNADLVIDGSGEIEELVLPVISFFDS